MTTMFAILYRWKLEPGTEETFREAWKAMTETIKEQRGTDARAQHIPAMACADGGASRQTSDTRDWVQRQGCA